jgi:glucuronate isomerase
MNDLEKRLLTEIDRLPFVDPHTHISPLAPTASNLDELIGYHYYTELAHSTGLDQKQLGKEIAPQQRVRNVLAQAAHFRNTVQFSWFVDIVREFLGQEIEPHALTEAQVDLLWQSALTRMRQADWSAQVLKRTGVSQVFLTNDFDDPLTGFDRRQFVPCLRADELVFRGSEPAVRNRLALVTGIEPSGLKSWRSAINALFQRFIQAGAAYAAVSLPPTFAPGPVPEAELNRVLTPGAPTNTADPWLRSTGIFWELARACADHQLPFALMIGVHRRVYRSGVYQGQDLFDQRTSLHAFAELFNHFPQVCFCISVLSSPQNQELASYAWIFPNVYPFGHWWYANAPAYIENDLRARLEVVPQSKLFGYYSDAYKLEFILPKFAMYRRCLARVLARDFVMDRGWSEAKALELARGLLWDNPRRWFRLPDLRPAGGANA